ncbi:hypothetical protein BaRGS_00021061 [Batillaria attramentaria]|uniref:Peroxisomal membrane protein PEX14 n=1 Tax=Batillaria attramentaria TaxID=370345 RepID=A0ABD0KKQ3_9CAEN
MLRSMCSGPSCTQSMENSELPKDVLAPAEGPRENLVATAVKFLQNPKVKQSPMYQKEAFLEKKGLTKEEIQLAVQRAGLFKCRLHTQPPVSPWTRAREIATTTAIVAAVSYAVYNLFKTYIRPWLIGKSEAEARMERLESSITQLQATIAESNAQVLDTLKAVQETLAMQRDRNIQSADMAFQQDGRALSEIKAEISSLKGLLLNRRQFPPPPVTSPVIPAWQRTPVREDQSEQSPAKAASGTGQPGSADSASDVASQSDVREDDTAAQIRVADSEMPPEKETTQTLDASTASSNQTPGDGVPASQSESDISGSQSATSHNGFEMLRPNSDSGDNGV